MQPSTGNPRGTGRVIAAFLAQHNANLLCFRYDYDDEYGDNYHDGGPESYGGGGQSYGGGGHSRSNPDIAQKGVRARNVMFRGQEPWMT